MAASGIEIDGRLFTKALAKRLNALENEKERDLLRLGVDIQNAARAAAPIGKRTVTRSKTKKGNVVTRRQRPGNLRRNIKVKVRRERGDYVVTIRSSAFYGRFIEFGTKDIPPKPFFRPAVHKSVNQFRRR